MASPEEILASAATLPTTLHTLDSVPPNTFKFVTPGLVAQSVSLGLLHRLLSKSPAASNDPYVQAALLHVSSEHVELIKTAQFGKEVVRAFRAKQACQLAGIDDDTFEQLSTLQLTQQALAASSTRTAAPSTTALLSRSQRRRQRQGQATTPAPNTKNAQAASTSGGMTTRARAGANAASASA